MTLWAMLHVGQPGASELIGVLSMGRLEHLDLQDPQVVDTTNTYVVKLNGEVVGQVRHRYGDGAWELLRRSVTMTQLLGKAPQR